MISLRTFFMTATLCAAIPAQDAALTVLHGVPGLPAPVEVFANGGLLFSFDYGEQQGPLSLPAGNYALDVRLNGASILTANASVTAGLDYSVIAHLDAAGVPRLSLFENDLQNPTLPGSRLYVRHTAEAPAVDVLLEQNGSVVATIPGLANGDQVVADVAPGSYDVRLNLAGTTTTAFGPVAIALENGNGYGVFATGVALQSSFELQQQIVPLAARVVVVHGIPGLAAPVTVQANGATLFSFDYRDVAGPLFVAPGSYTFDVLLNGAPVLTRSDTVARGDDVTIVAHLDGQAQPALSAFANDNSSLSGSQARVTVRHLADAPTVDVGVTGLNGFAATIPGLANGAEAVAALPTNNFQVRLFPAGSSTAVFGPVGFFAAAGVRYEFVAVGSLTGGTFDVLALQRDLQAAVPGEIVTTVGGWNCGPSIGAEPSAFDYGEPFAVTVTGADSNAMAIVNFGDSNSSFNGVPLPVALAPFGAPGCFLNTNLVASVMTAADASGRVEFWFTVPRSVFGQFLPGYFQVGTLSAQNALGVVTTEWLELR
ncbi:MAG: DUF4397 domain-containing protein [Planctomycetota bacterium]